MADKRTSASGDTGSTVGRDADVEVQVDDDAGTELELAADADVAVVDDDTVIESYLSSFESLSDQTAEEIGLEIVRKVLQAQTAEDVLSRQQVFSADDLGIRPFRLRGVRFNRSGFDSREGVYAVLDVVTHDDAETKLVACGGRNVMAQAFRLYQLRALPIDCKFTRTPTASGFMVLWLESAPPPVVSTPAAQ